jgi:chromosome partitioning protein
MLVVTVVNQKGGAGKTPTAVHLAFALAKTGGKVLFVDLDPQATASYHFLGKLYREQEPTIYTALTTFKPIPPIIVNERLHLLSAHIALEQAEVSLPAKKGLDYNRILDYLLKEYNMYEFAVIDTPGSRVSIFPVMAMTASDTVLVPVKTEKAATDATKETIDLIHDVQRPGGFNPNLLIWGILPNQYENTLHHREALADLREQYPTLVYPEPSRKTTRYNEALDLRMDIRELDPTLGEYWDSIAASVIEKGGRV